MNRGLFYSLGLSRNIFSSFFTPILMILVLSVITVTPKFYAGAGLIMMVSWMFFFFFEYNKVVKSNRTLKKVLLLGTFFVLICVIYKLIGLSSASMSYCIARPFLYFAPVLALMVIECCDNKQQVKSLFHFLALVIAINIVDNIRLTYEFGIENIAYQKLVGVIKDEGYDGLNFGGSMFVNMIVFYSCLMFLAFLKTKIRSEKLIFFSYWGVSVYFIVFCSLKASALVLMLISFALMYVSVKSKGRIGLLLTVAAFGGLLTFLLRDYIVSYLMDIIGSDRISQRLIMFTSGGDLEDNALSGRENLWLVSLRSWTNNVMSFFFGIGDHDRTDFVNTEASGIGNHSDLFDVLGRYGIIGAIVLYSSIKKYYDFLKKKYGVSFKWEIVSFFVLLVLMGLTKKFIAAQPPIVIFILFPLTLKYLSEQDC